MEPALSIIQGEKNDEREYFAEYKIFVAIYLYTHNPLNAFKKMYVCMQILPTDFFTFP